VKDIRYSIPDILAVDISEENLGGH